MTTRRERAIQAMERARVAHVEWAAYLDKHPNMTIRQYQEKNGDSSVARVASMVGGVVHQRKWARHYDEVLAELLEAPNK